MGYLKHLRSCTLDACACQASVCDTCGPTVTSVQCRTRSASRTKCGYTEFTSPSSPPKYYLTKTLSGSITITQYSDGGCTGTCDSSYTESYSGSCTISTATCAESAASQTQVSESPCGNVVSTYTGAAYTIGMASGDRTETLTQTTRSLTGVGCITVQNVTGTVTETLSSEYTTSALDIAVTSAVVAAAWSAFATCTTSAFYSMSADELTISKRQAEWRFNLSAPAPAGFKLLVDVLKNGAAYATACFNIAAGATYVDYAFFPGEVGTFTPSNWRVQPGAC